MNQEVKLVVKNGSTAEIVTYKKLRAPERHHTFSTVEGFVSYLNSDHCKSDNGLVFVGEKGVIADLQYLSALKTERVALPLLYSEQYNALKQITEKKHGVKALYRLLVTTLRGCISDELLLAIGNISISCKDDSSIRMDASLLSAATHASGYAVKFFAGEKVGEQDATIQWDWTWRGRIWQCWDVEFEVPLRLELNMEDGFGFVFHPDRIAQRVADARVDLAEHLATIINAARFTVHEGEV